MQACGSRCGSSSNWAILPFEAKPRFRPCQGGRAIWGNFTNAPDDHANCTHTHGCFISFRPAGSLGNETGVQNMTVDEAGTWILEHSPTSFQVRLRPAGLTGETDRYFFLFCWQRMIAANYSFGIERDEAALDRNDGVPQTWSNPLESKLVMFSVVQKQTSDANLIVVLTDSPMRHR